MKGVWDNGAINQLFDDFNRDKRMVSGAEAIGRAQVRCDPDIHRRKSDLVVAAPAI